MCVEMSVIEIGPIRMLRDLTGEYKKTFTKILYNGFYSKTKSVKRVHEIAIPFVTSLYISVYMCV